MRTYFFRCVIVVLCALFLCGKTSGKKAGVVVLLPLSRDRFTCGPRKSHSTEHSAKRDARRMKQGGMKK